MRLAIRAVALAALLATSSARAETYTLLVYEAPEQIALRRDGGDAGRAYWADYARYGQTLQASGALRGGAALETDAATPASIGGLRLGGYFQVDAAGPDAARALADKAPTVRHGGIVEVRPNLPGPAMNP